MTQISTDIRFLRLRRCEVILLLTGHMIILVSFTAMTSGGTTFIDRGILKMSFKVTVLHNAIILSFLANWQGLWITL